LASSAPRATGSPRRRWTRVKPPPMHRSFPRKRESMEPQALSVRLLDPRFRGDERRSGRAPTHPKWSWVPTLGSQPGERLVDAGAAGAIILALLAIGLHHLLGGAGDEVRIAELFVDTGDLAVDLLA